MVHSNQYNALVVSRLFAGILGSVPSILGAGAISDLFYLHERGRAFLIFSLSFLLGTVAGPTFGGFIVEHVDWPVEFWWTVGLQALALVLVLLFLEETGFNRDGGSEYPARPSSFMANRTATFFLGTEVVPAMNRSEIVRYYRLLNFLTSSLTRNARFTLRPQLLQSVYLRLPFWRVPSSYSHSGGCHDQHTPHRLSLRARKRWWIRLHTAAECRIYLQFLVRYYTCPNTRALSQRLASSLAI